MTTNPTPEQIRELENEIKRLKYYVSQSLMGVLEECGNSYSNKWCEDLLNIAKMSGVYTGSCTGRIVDLKSTLDDHIPERESPTIEQLIKEKG